MKKHRETADAADDTEEIADFDPYIGLATASTWWELGKRATPLLDSKDQKRKELLENWRSAATTRLIEDRMPVAATAITTDALEIFITTILRLLELKYDGKPIGKDVADLTKIPLNLQLSEESQYLDMDEPADYFWAMEYILFFSELAHPKTGLGWLHAVARCKSCNVFFIKQRINQRNHSEACRIKAANRKSYAKKTPEQKKTKRGRPRHSTQ